MMKENEMSIEQDKKIESSKSILPIFKNALNRTTKFLFIALLLLFFNIGAKYPVMSNVSSGEITTEEVIQKSEYDRYVKLYEEMYQKSLIQQIEFEAEVFIPNYFDFKYVEYTYNTARQFGITTRIAFRLMYKESSFIDTVRSPVGAEGLMQLMPTTRKKFYDDLRVDTLNLDKAQEDIYIGLYYISYLEDFWRDRGNAEKYLLRLSIAAYNAGYGNVIKYKGVPPFKETQNFVEFIMKPHSNPMFYASMIKKNNTMSKDIS